MVFNSYFMDEISRQVPRTLHLSLYCTVQHYTVLYCTVLHYTVLYCPILYCTALHYCIVLHCTTVLHCTVLYCTVLYCTVLYCTVLNCFLYYTILYCTVRVILPRTPPAHKNHISNNYGSLLPPTLPVSFLSLLYLPSSLLLSPPSFPFLPSLQEWQSNSIFRKNKRISHGISALVLTFRSAVSDCLSALSSHSFFCTRLCLNIVILACRSVYDIYR
jgi:hypothetical protein